MLRLAVAGRSDGDDDDGRSTVRGGAAVFMPVQLAALAGGVVVLGGMPRRDTTLLWPYMRTAFAGSGTCSAGAGRSEGHRQGE